MAVKTITVTTDAYEALKSKKECDESFSETILRITKRKPLSSFFGVLGEEGGAELERIIKERRKRNAIAHRQRRQEMIRSIEGS